MQDFALQSCESPGRFFKLTDVDLEVGAMANPHFSVEVAELRLGPSPLSGSIQSAHILSTVMSS